MKKRKTAVILTVGLLLLCTLSLVGCSAAGSLMNCVTNACGSAFDCVAKCNTCEASYYFWSCASFGILCRGCDENCHDDEGHNYDDACIATCYLCGEVCRSNVSDKGTEDLTERAAAGELDMEYRIVDRSTETLSYGVVRGTVTVEVRFGGEGDRYDNVSVTCSIPGLQESTRWIGTAKSGKTYTVECEFYVTTAAEFEGQTVSVHVVGKQAK